ncbi:hypothetical protein J7295_04493 [Nakaseomyces glabratus]|nr:hypothetical protein J7298_04532 [Nakaseomyces glabratus]KAH7594164.1 hypothetical protein J7295_04493 [Nakaseomyces glabratus]KAH7611352.1 hypothetical protein J7292_04502 [Nakaseomyces glabratus]
MKYLSVFATFVAILSWACATVYPNFYKDKTIVLDGMGTEEFTIPWDKILSLVNTSLTLKNFAHISIGEGVLIQEKSLLTIIPPSGTSKKFNFTLRGELGLENESKFIFDGSGITYEDEADAVNNFVFDIYGNSSGIQVYKGNTLSVTLPTIKNSIPNYQGESPHIRFAGSTVDQFIFEPPYVFVSLMIIAGKFEVLSPGSKTGSQFDKVIWRVDFGVSGLPKTNPNTPSYIRDKLTGEITCEGILAVYNDMFAFTNNAVLHTLGYIGYSVVSPITLDLSMGPIRRPTNYEYLVALPAGQDGITLTGYKYTADTDISNAHQYLFYYFYDNDATKEDEISVSTDNSDVRILHSNPSQTVTVHGDSALNIGYYKGDRIDSFVGFDGLDFSKYKKELAVYFYESFQYSSTTTTKFDEYTTEIIEIIVSGTLGIDNKPSPVTISSTIYNQLRETTETVDLGNGVTEYHVLDYFPVPQDDKEHPYGTSTKIITYSPPPVTITATTAADYVETDWISFFITTNDKGEIITDSTLFNATRDYNLPEAPHTSFGPAPPAETKTVDLGNEVTEYLVISYWTTTNEFGGLITTSSTRTYSPPPVTITATTAADYVETDWISFFITTNDKGEIITDSTLFNATREYIDAEAPHLSSSMEGVLPESEADYTTTIDKGNDEFETDLVSHITTKDSDGKPTTITTTIPLKPSEAGEADYTTTIISDGHTITEVVSHVTTTDSDGKTITYITTMASYGQVDEGVFTSPAPYSQPPVVMSTITEDDGSSKTVVISYFPSEGEDGVTRTGTTTVSTITPGEADYTTTIVSDGHTITEVVSHVTTTDSDGKTITYITTMASYGQVDEGVFTSPAPYSQPPVVMSTITEDDGSSKTVVISYFPSEGEDGVTRTGTTTVSTITPGEADYTTTIVSDGHTITEVVSHVTTTDPDGKTVTYTTTIFSNDWLLVNSESGLRSNHPTLVASKGYSYTAVDFQSIITSNSGNTAITTKMPANDNENHGLSSVNGASVSSGRNTIRSMSLIITNTLGSAKPIIKSSYSTNSPSSSVPQEVAGDSSKYVENVSSVGIMLPQISKPHVSSASISVVHNSSRPVISTGSRPSDVSARPTENTPTFGSMPVQSGAENDASVSSTNDNQNTHTAQSRIQQLGKTSSDLVTTALVLPSSSAANISHTGGPSDTQIASVLQGSGFKIKVKSEVMILLVTVFLFLGSL